MPRNSLPQLWGCGTFARRWWARQSSVLRTWPLSFHHSRSGDKNIQKNVEVNRSRTWHDKEVWNIIPRFGKVRMNMLDVRPYLGHLRGVKNQFGWPQGSSFMLFHADYIHILLWHMHSLPKFFHCAVGSDTWMLPALVEGTDSKGYLQQLC